jgi:hypothetical protein
VSNGTCFVPGGGDKITPINMATLVVGTPVTYSQVTTAIAVSNNQQWLAVYSAVTGGNILIIDRWTGNVTATITGTFSSVFMAFSPDDSLLYFSSEAPGNLVQAVTTSNWTISGTVAVTQPGQIAWIGSTAYVAAATGSGVVYPVTGGATPALGIGISTGNGAVGLVYVPQTGNLYCSNGSAISMSVIDVATQSVIATFSGFSGAPYQLCTDPEGVNVWAQWTGLFGKLSIIATATNVITKITGGGTSGVGEISADGTEYWTNKSGSTAPAIFNTATNALIHGFTGISAPGGVALVGPSNVPQLVGVGRAINGY